MIVDIRCNKCGCTFKEHIDICGYSYLSSVCCPECGFDIDLIADRDGNAEVKE